MPEIVRILRNYNQNVLQVAAMIPRIKKLSVLDDFRLAVEFDDDHKVVYDVKEDIDVISTFKSLTDVVGLFQQARVDSSRTCVYWNDQIDLASDSIYLYGKPLAVG